MGKNSAIKSLGRCIGNVVMHKLLLKHTNKPESKHHLDSEIVEYSADAFEKAQEFTWNEKDKEEIKLKAIARVSRLREYYPDVKLDDKEIDKVVLEVMAEMLV